MIKKIGIIGAGTMGSGIAAASAINGFETLLYDISPEAVQKAVSGISKGFQKLEEKGKIDAAKRKTAEEKIVQINDLTGLAVCDIIIEAAIENIDLKKELYKKLDEISKPDAILATNTSSFSITSISTAVKKNPGRVAGMHFFNPANIMKLVEVIKGEFTSEETVNTVTQLCKELGKVPVLCMDTPAFIVNRVARAFYGESLKIMGEENLDPELVDTVMKEEGGFAMGPFELMDLIGIDVNLSVTKSVYEAFFYDQKYKPSPIQQKMVDSGLLGRKTKQGFYKY
ncbi:MAG TPA: 3-hydroxyacyl-CoA dehydrogenase NAD-binding domain-containing protein [Ignavibacteria bacterium]|nr:3-hydroxyacyl-CoA dehydrogenase NAD-binding domain-containing protein [Ignavibacteria bacterium]